MNIIQVLTSPTFLIAAGFIFLIIGALYTGEKKEALIMKINEANGNQVQTLYYLGKKKDEKLLKKFVEFNQKMGKTETTLQEFYKFKRVYKMANMPFVKFFLKPILNGINGEFASLIYDKNL